MAVSEPDRHELYQRLEEAVGKKPAETFMSLVSRSDLATKQDIHELRQATKQDIHELRQITDGLRQAIEELRQGLADLRVELHKSLRVQLLAFAAIVAGSNATLFAALKLT